MTVKDHLAAGVLFGIGAVGVKFTKYSLALTHLQVLMFAAIVIGSVFPDIDLTLTNFKKERFRDRTFFSHRGITHHILLPVFIVLFAEIFTIGETKSILIAFAIGVAIHIITDMFSPLGVPFGFKYQKRMSIPVYYTGQWSEKVFLIFFLLLIVVVFYSKQIIGL